MYNIFQSLRQYCLPTWLFRMKIGQFITFFSISQSLNALKFFVFTDILTCKTFFHRFLAVHCTHYPLVIISHNLWIDTVQNKFKLHEKVQYAYHFSKLINSIILWIKYVNNFNKVTLPMRWCALGSAWLNINNRVSVFKTNSSIQVYSSGS